MVYLWLIIVNNWNNQWNWNQWIGLRENLQENPMFNGKNYGFL